jgi:hypothetical protein
MPIPRYAYEQLCAIYGEALIRRFYHPISAVRR